MTEKDIDINKGEVITYRELLRIYRENEDLELKKLTLKCMNCGHLDTVMNMRINSSEFGKPQIKQEKSTKNSLSDTTDMKKKEVKNSQKYQEEFKCPECGSTAIKLTQRSYDKVVAEAL